MKRLGGLVAISDRLTVAEQRAIVEAAELQVRFDPTMRQATFKVNLGVGLARVSEGGLCQ